MRKMYFYLFGLVLLVFLGKTRILNTPSFSKIHNRSINNIQIPLVFFFLLLTATTASSKKLIRDGLPNEYARSYVAQIQVNGIHMCGGTVISSRRHVLTAAHCVWVMRGTLFRNYDANVVTNSIYPNGTGGTFHPIEKVVVHNKYMTNRTLQDDIAIIVVSAYQVKSNKEHSRETKMNSQSFSFQLKDTRESQSLRGIQLPVRNVPNGFIGTLMGWGAHAANSTAQILSKVSPQMSDRSHCLVIAPCDNLYPNNFCAKSPKGYGTCDVRIRILQHYTSRIWI